MSYEVYLKIMMEVWAACEACPIREKCCEDTCPFWSIEQICEKEVKPKGSYQCFHCLSSSVNWQSDFSFEDYGLEGEGVINVCHCSNCGADIEYYVPIDSSDEQDSE